MKPNFMVIGAAKCATTTIRSLFGRHPDVFIVSHESQFFNHDQVFHRGIAWYESLYAQAGNKRLRGEGCNGCTMRELFPNGFERLTRYAPDLKLIYVVRDPFERIESFWLELRSQHPDYVHYDFNQAVRVNREWLTDPSNYYWQLEPYRDFYGDDAIHVVFYEDFRRDPVGTMRGCFRFLGVDPNIDVSAGTSRLNESDGKFIASPWLSRLRSIPGYRRMIDRLPFRFRDRIARRLLYSPIRARPKWRPETRAWVRDLLHGDLQTFLARYNKPTDFWDRTGDKSIPERCCGSLAVTPEPRHTLLGLSLTGDSVAAMNEPLSSFIDPCCPRGVDEVSAIEEVAEEARPST